jgi:hypothetical protein
VQSSPLPSVRKGHLEWLRSPRGRGHGKRAAGPALHLPLNRPRTSALAPLLAGALLVLPLTGTASAASASANSIGADSPSVTTVDPETARAPRLMAAADAIGTPFAAALISVQRNASGICTAGIWKPTVLMTAAHCLVQENSGTLLDPASFVVVNPGSPFRLTRGGVEGASPARVVSFHLPDGFRTIGTDVPANDIAFVVLDRPLAEASFSRLATTVELARWFNQGTPVSAIGYGHPSPFNRITDIPREAALPIVRVAEDYRGSSGLVMLSSRIGGVDACQGDSGGPRFVNEFGSSLLLGNIAGGSCNGIPGPGVIGFTGMSYRPLANQALTAAGLPTIPSGPTEVKAARVQDQTTVWWQPPADSAPTVVGYDVLDAAGTVLCSTDQTVCTFPTGASGAQGMSVRARNAQGEGEAVFAPNAEMLRAAAPRATVLSANTPRKPVRIRITPVDYPVVSEYRVTTAQGRTLCRIDPNATPLQCRTRLGEGRYRFRVVAVTPQGDAVPSRLSPAVRVR